MPVISGYEIGPSASLAGAYLHGADLGEADLARVDLREADLHGADLHGANLREANLRGAYLAGADLYGADLREANLRGANLAGAYLTWADLREANLAGANLVGANLVGANLGEADLDGVDLREADLAWARNVPQQAVELTAVVPAEGEVTGWKKCRDGVIVKLLIPAGAKRSNATTRKCRAESATVLEVIGADEGISTSDPCFRYRAGETVSAPGFSEDRWAECSDGIHFFLTREEAQSYTSI